MRPDKQGEVDRIYRLLKTWLIECKLSPGNILSEVDLARRCGASRTPVREAFNRLAQDGWITRIRYKGYVVAPVSIRDLLELYDYRKLLECFAAERASQIAGPEQLEELAAIIAVEQCDNVDVGEVVAENDLFHLGIAKIAGNQRVYDQLALTLEYVHRLDKLSTQKSQSWIPHGDILSALRSRKAHEARLAMAAHIDYARERMLQLLAG
ncbi:MAG TPA: GntR family transcriptional regulator [Bryobacteraceae bacterium]|nr:GntR family transcriptional regulator [Bryobacteraceae bacterium]